MTDLTKITTPFGLLDPETQEALRKWEHGVECFSASSVWCEPINMVFFAHCTYRARPAPLVPDTIDWSHVAPEWKWMARDGRGGVMLYNDEPHISVGDIWDCGSGDYHEAEAFASYRRGTVAWQDSLVERPE